MFARNVNIPLRSVKYGAINAYVGVQVERSAIVASALMGENCQLCTPVPLIPEKVFTHRTRGGFGNRAFRWRIKKNSFLWFFQ
jgi:hypothetical protein